MNGKIVRATTVISTALDETTDRFCEKEKKVDGVMVQTNVGIKITDDPMGDRLCEQEIQWRGRSSYNVYATCTLQC